MTLWPRKIEEIFPLSVQLAISMVRASAVHFSRKADAAMVLNVLIATLTTSLARVCATEQHVRASRRKSMHQMLMERIVTSALRRAPASMLK
jgi:hypothetical protein